MVGGLRATELAARAGGRSRLRAQPPAGACEVGPVEVLPLGQSARRWWPGRGWRLYRAQTLPIRVLGVVVAVLAADGTPFAITQRKVSREGRQRGRYRRESAAIPCENHRHGWPDPVSRNPTETFV